MENSDKIKNFDPNNIADASGNIYGLPFTVDDASLVIIPVPWEVTVSYSAGTAEGPEAIFNASLQVDLYDPFVKDAWKLGIAMEEINYDIKSKGDTLRDKAETYISMFADGEVPESNSEMQEIRAEIDNASKELNEWVKTQCLKHIDKNKKVALIGGDHSTPLGLITALAERNDSFSILHIDAHADLRIAYEGFEFSHASIMYNALKVPQVNKLVQVGIRDYCEAEVDLINSDNRIETYFDRDIKHQMYQGKSWSMIVDDIIGNLTGDVYLSIDIDGLDPKLCPNTGTPVPGGLEFDQLLFMLEKLVKSGRKIIGFDINEVAPGDNEWDANVGARLLYRVANLCLVS